MCQYLLRCTIKYSWNVETVTGLKWQVNHAQGNLELRHSQQEKEQEVQLCIIAAASQQGVFNNNWTSSPTKMNK